MKTNSFIRFGWLWIGIGVVSTYYLWDGYGRGLPNNSTEWLGEIFVGMVFITGTVLIAVGRYLRSER